MFAEKRIFILKAQEIMKKSNLTKIITAMLIWKH